MPSYELQVRLKDVLVTVIIRDVQFDGNEVLNDVLGKSIAKQYMAAALV